MGKRFTETTKWGDTWFQDLAPAYKCAWIYMLDHCDNAGVWVVNTKLLSFLVGESITWEDIKDKFGDRLLDIGKGRIWIRKFIDFQFGDLSPACKPHAKIIAALQKYGLWGTYHLQTYGVPDRVGDRVPDTLQEEEKEEDQDQDLRKGSAEGKPPTPLLKLPVRSEEAVAHAAARRVSGPSQADYDRAAAVLALYPTRAKDGRAVRIDLAAQNLLGVKICQSPDFPWEEAAKLEGLNETPMDAARWIATQPDAVNLETRRRQAKEPPKSTEPPRKKAQALV